MIAGWVDLITGLQIALLHIYPLNRSLSPFYNFECLLLNFKSSISTSSTPYQFTRPITAHSNFEFSYLWVFCFQCSYLISIYWIGWWYRMICIHIGGPIAWSLWPNWVLRTIWLIQKMWTVLVHDWRKWAHSNEMSRIRYFKIGHSG